jgi:putative transposase
VGTSCGDRSFAISCPGVLTSSVGPALGVRLVRSRVGCPQDNGGHERMHRDLSEPQLSPAKTRSAQQRDCDRWLVDFNHVRPHSALAEVYRPLERRPMAVHVPNYPPEGSTWRITTDGSLCFEGDQVRLGQALSPQFVGFRHEQGLRWRAFFFDIDLGVVEIASLQSAVSTSTVSGVNANEEAKSLQVSAV